MRLVLVSSIDALARQAAAEHLHARQPDALFVRWDPGNRGGLVRHHFHRGGSGLPHHVDPDAADEPGPGLSPRTDHRAAALHDLGHHVVEQLRALADGDGARIAVLLLPMGLSSNDALHALGHSAPVLAAAPTGLFIDTVVLACDPEVVEDVLWDVTAALPGEAPTLLEQHRDPEAAGFVVEGEYRRTAGEFLAAELAFCSTLLAVHTVHPGLVPHDPEAYRRGVELVRELGPHLTVVDAGAVQRSGLPPGAPGAADDHSTDGGRLGAFDLPSALLRCRPGTIPSHAPEGEGAATVVLRTDRPLDPALFRDVLGDLVRGACRVRGTLHFHDDPHRPVAIEGVGPHVWLEPAGIDPGGLDRIVGLLERTDRHGPVAHPAPTEDIPCGCAIALTSPLLDPQRLQLLLQQATGGAAPGAPDADPAPPGARTDIP
ncbi:GTP-binding protein [Kocuria turfanensis]|uniref:CobW C-terminal domain-containing protein n=1 Tax=Kocuria turfanensis TaxID=388357 RepID=A0A512ID62_9MICC|nr:GTP-binding protein [Kocuria turfanensis]GEO95621.1 hypothetical protein KTU01_17440 [Kocuria turfanensis]